MPPIVFDGDSENRGPEADFGLPKIENSCFHLFAKIFAQTVVPSGPCARIARAIFVRGLPRGGFEILHTGQLSHKGSL